MLLQSEKLYQNEIEYLTLLKDKSFNIIRIIDHQLNYGNSDYEGLILLEYCPYGTLFNVIEENCKYGLQGIRDEKQLIDIVNQIASGLVRIHEHGIIHRDIKIENILLGDDRCWKICDFGSATKQKYNSTLDSDEKKIIIEEIQKFTTAIYRAPEQIDPYLKFQINEKVDIWALGCVMYTLMYHRPPFDDGQLAQINGTFRFQSTPQYSEPVKHLVKRLLQVNPDHRPSADQVFNATQFLNVSSLARQEQEQQEQEFNFQSKLSVEYNGNYDMIGNQQNQEIQNDFNFGNIQDSSYQEDKDKSMELDPQNENQYQDVVVEHIDPGINNESLYNYGLYQGVKRNNVQKRSASFVEVDKSNQVKNVNLLELETVDGDKVQQNQINTTRDRRQTQSFIENPPIQQQQQIFNNNSDQQMNLLQFNNQKQDINNQQQQHIQQVQPPQINQQNLQKQYQSFNSSLKFQALAQSIELIIKNMICDDKLGCTEKPIQEQKLRLLIRTVCDTVNDGGSNKQMVLQAVSTAIINQSRVSVTNMITGFKYLTIVMRLHQYLPELINYDLANHKNQFHQQFEMWKNSIQKSQDQQLLLQNFNLVEIDLNKLIGHLSNYLYFKMDLCQNYGQLIDLAFNLQGIFNHQSDYDSTAAGSNSLYSKNSNESRNPLKIKFLEDLMKLLNKLTVINSKLVQSLSTLKDIRIQLMLQIVEEQYQLISLICHLYLAFEIARDSYQSSLPHDKQEQLQQFVKQYQIDLLRNIENYDSLIQRIKGFNELSHLASRLPIITQNQNIIQIVLQIKQAYLSMKKHLNQQLQIQTSSFIYTDLINIHTLIGTLTLPLKFKCFKQFEQECHQQFDVCLVDQKFRQGLQNYYGQQAINPHKQGLHTCTNFVQTQVIDNFKKQFRSQFQSVSLEESERIKMLSNQKTDMVIKPLIDQFCDDPTNQKIVNRVSLTSSEVEFLTQREQSMKKENSQAESNDSQNIENIDLIQLDISISNNQQQHNGGGQYMDQLIDVFQNVPQQQQQQYNEDFEDTDSIRTDSDFQSADQPISQDIEKKDSHQSSLTKYMQVKSSARGNGPSNNQHKFNNNSDINKDFFNFNQDDVVIHLGQSMMVNDTFNQTQKIDSDRRLLGQEEAKYSQIDKKQYGSNESEAVRDYLQIINLQDQEVQRRRKGWQEVRKSQNSKLNQSVDFLMCNEEYKVNTQEQKLEELQLLQLSQQSTIKDYRLQIEEMKQAKNNNKLAKDYQAQLDQLKRIIKNSQDNYQQIVKKNIIYQEKIKNFEEQKLQNEKIHKEKVEQVEKILSIKQKLQDKQVQINQIAESKDKELMEMKQKLQLFEQEKQSLIVKLKEQESNNYQQKLQEQQNLQQQQQFKIQQQQEELQKMYLQFTQQQQELQRHKEQPIQQQKQQVVQSESKPRKWQPDHENKEQGLPEQFLNHLFQGREFLKISLKDFFNLKEIGEGTAGKVYKAKYKYTDVALKKLKSQSLVINNELSKEFQREIEALSKICHPNIVQFMGATVDHGHPVIVTEFCNGGTLFEVLHENKKSCPVLSLKQQVKMGLDIARGMHFMHCMSPPLIHRDLKSLNILLQEPVNSPNDYICCKVTDFGLARSIDEGMPMMSNRVGTFHWMAPEVMEYTTYDEKADVYSFGIVLWEILAREPPFKDYRPEQIIRGVREFKQRPQMDKVDQNCPQILKNIVIACWEQEPKNRPQFSDVIEGLLSVQIQYCSN